MVRNPEYEAYYKAYIYDYQNRTLIKYSEKKEARQIAMKLKFMRKLGYIK